MKESWLESQGRGASGQPVIYVAFQRATYLLYLHPYLEITQQTRKLRQGMGDGGVCRIPQPFSPWTREQGPRVRCAGD